MVISVSFALTHVLTHLIGRGEMPIFTESCVKIYVDYSSKPLANFRKIIAILEAERLLLWEF